MVLSIHVSVYLQTYAAAKCWLKPPNSMKFSFCDAMISAGVAAPSSTEVPLKSSLFLTTARGTVLSAQAKEQRHF